MSQDHITDKEKQSAEMLEQNSKSQDLLMDYLYSEMSSHEADQFEKEINANSALQSELKSFLQLRNLSQRHLPDQKVPSQLSKKLLVELGLRKPWYEALVKSFMRPALAGAFVLAIAIAVGYQFRDKGMGEIAKTDPKIVQPIQPEVSSDLDLNDLVPTSVASRQPEWVSSSQPRWRGFSSRQPITLASVGSSVENQTRAPFQVDEDIDQLKQESDLALAHFYYTQGLRLRAMGQHEEAARHFGLALKKYPTYALKYEVFAQRVDCLFAAEKYEQAQRELAWLSHVAPDLADSVKKRWIQ